MNKKIIMIIAILVAVFTVNTVKAEREPIYQFDWEVEGNEVAYQNTGYKDGYIMVDSQDENSVLTYYDKNGEAVKSKTLQNIDILEIESYEDDIYALVALNTYSPNFSVGLVLLNENLQIVEQVDLDMDSFYNHLMMGKIFIVKEDGVYLLASDGDDDLELKKYKRDLSTYTTLSEEKLKEMINPEAIINILMNTHAQLYSIDFNGEYIAYVTRSRLNTPECQTGSIPSVSPIPSTTKPTSKLSANPLSNRLLCYTYSYGVIKNDTGESVWSANLDPGVYVNEINLIDEYTIISGYDDDEEQGAIVVYDKTGNEVQTILSEGGFTRIAETEKGIVAVEGICASEYSKPDIDSLLGAIVDVTLTSPRPGEISNLNKAPQGTLTVGSNICRTKHQTYYLYHLIEPKITEGKGTIEVASKGKAGDPVTFVVTPEEGYTLGVIKVTTADGEVLTFTNYTFTMPSADVTIEATFIKEDDGEIADEKENPKTADIAIATIALAAATTLGIFIYQKRRLKELK